MTYSFSNTPVYVSEGQTVRFKFKAPSQWNTTQSVTIQIGEQTTVWYITTIPEDFAPDPYPFQTLDDADAGIMYVYGDGSRPGESILTIVGLTTSTEASVTVTGSAPALSENFSIRYKKVSDGETEFSDWQLPNPGALTVKNTDQIQTRLKSNSIPGLSSYVDLTIGARSERWTINAKVTPPNVPVPFPDFDDLTNQPLNTAVYSNIIQVQGLNDTAIIASTNSNLYVGVSDTNTFFTDTNGYEILSNTVFELVSDVPAPTINNGQYLQLYIVTENTAGAVSSNPLSIGDGASGSIWSVSNGNFPSTTPKDFSFVNQTDVLEDALIASAPAPDPNGTPGFISELGTNVEVDVELVSSTSSNDSGGDEPRVKIQYAEGGESSIGLFPTKVNNGDRIVLYNRSSGTFSTSLTPSVVTTTIKVGQRVLDPWSITTNSGPDTDAVFSIPTNLVNQVPNTEVLSSIVSVSGINRPITINATNGGLISIDFATPVAGPVTFDPTIHTSFRVFITTGSGLSDSKQTTVSIGTGSPNQFIWQVSNYAVAPPPPDLKGAWYSKKGAYVDSNGDIKESKEDGHAIGTIITILKQPNGTYGLLDGSRSSRYPGYYECAGQTLDKDDYPFLFDVIGYDYGGAGSSFKLPDYRNRKLSGTGVVDGNRASSAFLPIDGGSSIYEPGGTGGWWYVDDVDVAGDNPYEIIVSDDTNDTTGIESNFFSIGTVKTVFAQDLTQDVDFTVAASSSVTALVGPLLDTSVNVPIHSHLYVAAISDGITGDPLIQWDTRGSSKLDSHTVSGGGIGQGQLSIEDDAPDAYNPTTIANAWISRLNSIGESQQFEAEWNQIANQPDLITLVTEMIQSLNPNNIDASDRAALVISANTWWPSPYSVVSDDYMEIATGLLNRFYDTDGEAGTGSRDVACVFDTNQYFTRIDPYSPPILDGDDGSIQTHAHLITTQPVLDPSEDYTYGNTSGAGNGKEGLGSAQTTLNITFNQSDVGMELNPGLFTLNTSVKKPIPDVVFSPNRTVPLAPEFHKAKYIIKAF